MRFRLRAIDSGIRHAGFLVALVSVAAVAAPAAEPVDFNRDVRPILSNFCYECHGPDEAQRQTALRLDVEESAYADLGDGRFAIVPGKPQESELVRRITAKDPAMRMPPADHDKRLSPEHIAILTRWVEEGAEWKGHWAFLPPERPEPPPVRQDWVVHNPIDQFLFARLEREGFAPEPEADKTTLIRRVTFDLTGLPPTLEEIDAFLADESPDAYKNLVERLLQSPRYGEHMARYWLDAARYGDTHGLHLDNERSLWPYRDWVIDAFNNNMPFDQFTVEQLAGDLLPNPTLSQKVATGFNRCNVTTSEGGSIAAEYLVRYAVDRVETTATVWLGLTAGCAVCHDHKFDPLTQKEFYQLFAFFNSLTEKAMDGNALLPPPFVKVPSPEQQARMDELRAAIAPLEEQIRDALAKVEYVEPLEVAPVTQAEPEEFVWVDDVLPDGAKPEASGNSKQWEFVSAPEHPVYSGSKSTTRTGQGTCQHFFTQASSGLRIGKGDKLFAYVYLDPKNPPQEVMLQFNDGSWNHRATWGNDVIQWGKADSPSRRQMGPLPEIGQWVRLEVDAQHVGLQPGAVVNGWAFTQYDGTVYWDRAGIVTRTPQDGMQFQSQLAWEAFERGIEKSSAPQAVRDIIKTDRTKRNAEQQTQLREYFLEYVYAGARDVFEPLHNQRAKLQQELKQIEKAVPGTMIMEDMQEPRPAYVLVRGQYDQPSEEVKRGVPAFLPPLKADGTPNRLDLARWIVDPSNPLTARVAVNRYWQHYFGTGLVETTGDFGSQGEWPSHPRLLDWLATEFIRSGWDVKQIQRLIVMSAAYRQSSRITPEKYARDPENRLLARGPRFRLAAEMIRDNALAVSGLLVPKIGGPSVKPYQPPGLWEAVGYTNSNTANFKRDDGPALYRRSLYTFWKRTSPPPSMLTFDAPSRESCTVRRARTNTPLQALVLMNDIQFVEAARALAERMMTEAGPTPEDRVTFAFRLATARRPASDELDVFLRLYAEYLKDYGRDREAATKLVSVGESGWNQALDVAELAAYTMIANLILNLDETVTKG